MSRNSQKSACMFCSDSLVGGFKPKVQKAQRAHSIFTGIFHNPLNFCQP